MYQAIAAPMLAPKRRYRSKRIILVAQYFSIEPLGILYLAGLITSLDWECQVVLVKDHNFQPLYDLARDWNASIVGFQVWTGWHLQTFAAADKLRQMGVEVAIGGPHATYFDKECAAHADWVVKATGFGPLQDMLAGTLPHGTHFDKGGRGLQFPLPNRDVVYEAYPELGASPIKSMFGSVGCPMTCTYCYAPSFNEMHGKFEIHTRSIDELVREANAIRERWPLRLIYFQDDIFGYTPTWVEEFAERWPREVGVPFHAQIRLELARGNPGKRRLDAFVRAGCTGITLAIESGVAFMRDRVLFRHMDEETILEGCKAIMDRGMSLRTEQILAIPFSNTDSDLETLALNRRINPTMAWCSLLAPYGGTDIGTICANFGFHPSNNDDLEGRSYERSLLRHPAGGRRDIEPIVEKLGIRPKAVPKLQPLVNMRVIPRSDTPLLGDVWYQEMREERTPTERRRIYDLDSSIGAVPVPTVRVTYEPVGTPTMVGTIEYLDDEANKRYCDDSFRLQRLFNLLAKVPDGEGLGRKVLTLSGDAWSWKGFGRCIAEHLRPHLSNERSAYALQQLAREMGAQSSVDLPKSIAENPFYFCYFPGGGIHAKELLEKDVFTRNKTMAELIDEISTLSRRHLFHYGLYKLDACEPPILAQ